MVLLGIDEAGRGAWAGPLSIAGCVITDPDHPSVKLLADSKMVSKNRREQLFATMNEFACTYHIFFDAQTIDLLGLTKCIASGIEEIILSVGRVDKIIFDGNTTLELTNKFPHLKSMVRADSTIKEVMAASIMAKVIRDQLMEKLSMLPEYEQYGFASHVGYGTKKHHEAIRQHGVSNLHRRSFAPIKELLA